MSNMYQFIWEDTAPRRRLRILLVVSLVTHFAAFIGVYKFTHKERPKPIPITYSIQLIEDAPVGPPMAQPKPKPPEPKPPEPKPKPPEPKPEEKPKPKPEEKPKPKPAEKPKPKPEEKPKPKPEEKPKPKPKPELKPVDPAPDLDPIDPEPELLDAIEAPMESVTVTQSLPSVLGPWIAVVQARVRSVWSVPPGINLSSPNITAQVYFVVDRRGNIIEGPTVVAHADDPAIGDSGVGAISLAQPLPWLPDAYEEPEVSVTLNFTPER